MTKWFKTAGILLLLLLLPMHALAAGESLTVNIPFYVSTAPGTVVIEAVGDAPLPEETEFVGSTEGEFALSFSAPGNYFYDIYQLPDEKLDANVSYDDTVYRVEVSVFLDENDELYAVVVLSNGDAHKPERVEFVNLWDVSDVVIDKTQMVGDITPTHDLLQVSPGDEITYYITVTSESEYTAFDMVVTDEIPEGLTVVAGSISDGGTEEDGVITWNLGDIPPGVVRTVHFTCTIPAVSGEAKWVNMVEGSFFDGSLSGFAYSARTELQSMEVVSQYAPNVSPSPTTSNSPSPSPSPENVNSPYTGDNSNVVLWFVLAASSLGGMLLIASVYLRRRDENRRYTK